MNKMPGTKGRKCSLRETCAKEYARQFTKKSNSSNGGYSVMNNYLSGYDLPQNEIPTQEIAPNNYIYYICENRHNREIDILKNTVINELLDPNAKKLIDKYIFDMTNKKEGGKSYSRINTSRKRLYTGDYSCNGSSLKNKVNRSVQTNLLINVCTHRSVVGKNLLQNHNGIRNTAKYTNKEVSSVNNKSIKYIKSNNFRQNGDRLLLSSHQLQSLKNMCGVNTLKTCEENRKKLHVTKIGVGNKNSTNVPVNFHKSLKSNPTNSSVNSDMRYINIKCSTKLQHVPISVQSLNSKHAKNSTAHLRHKAKATTNSSLQNQNANTVFACSSTAVSNACIASSSYSSFNQSGSNLITKSQSVVGPSTKRVQLQELKTYSRKASDNNSCYLLNTFPSSTSSEQKYHTNHANGVDKYSKLQHTNGSCSSTQKINVNSGDVYSIVSSCSPSKVHNSNSINGKFPIPNLSACANNIVTVTNNSTNDYIGTQLSNVISTRPVNDTSNIGESMSIKLVTNYNTSGCKDSNAKHELQNHHVIY